jgi:uncharacterized membrane protein
MRVLYAGDGQKHGAAKYLLSVLEFLKAEYTYVSSSEILTPVHLKSHFDVVIFSDYRHDRLPVESENRIIQMVNQGTGFMMVGGWSSFRGLSGHWQNSKIAKILPVTCLRKDDRRNFSGGAALQIKKGSPKVFPKSLLQDLPVICGLNEVNPGKESRTLLTAKPLKMVVSKSGKAGVKVRSEEYPLLVIHPDPKKKVAALTTDLAPHWCGGLIDWGSKREKLNFEGIYIELGNKYIEFISSLLKWLSPARGKI